jgi:hypothetical protein
MILREGKRGEDKKIKRKRKTNTRKKKCNKKKVDAQ